MSQKAAMESKKTSLCKQHEHLAAASAIMQCK
jgi:hypothetical protein